MTPPPRQRALLLVAVLLGAAPLGFALFQRAQTESDVRMLWMAAVTTIFTAGVLAASIGRRRTRKAAYSQAMVILVVSTLVAGGTAFMLGATSGPGVWPVAFVFSALLSASSFLGWFSRSTS
ncbi:MAG TPA: hypothetical protein VFC35_09425 [Gemmatimonadaceae bacterium]|nr:hypothetical protein [Gemmatimonadaceae bacterium]